MDKQERLSKLGQMFVVGFPGKSVDDGIKKLIYDYRIGNIILFGRNIGSPAEVSELTSKLQEEAKLAGHTQPLLICTDQENGIVRRLKEPATLFPGAMSLGATGNIKLIEKIGLATGLELRDVGINWNLAPVFDVNNNPNNPVINVRSFGEEPDKVGNFGTSWMKGMQEAGVAATLKHFPGHGDTDVDSHLNLPSINHSLEHLFEVELVPFIEGIKNGADVIMTAHIYFSILEHEFGCPATLSKNVLTGLLRNKLGFKGVITTDCLEMNAISKTVGVANGALQAAIAGADMLMVSHTYHYQVEAVNRLLTASFNGEISEEQINQSSNRIVKLKEKYSTVENKQIDQNQHKTLAEKAYRESISVLKNNSIPLNNENTEKYLALYTPQKPPFQAAERGESVLIPGILKEYGEKIDFLEIKNNVNYQEQLIDIKNEMNNYDQIIIFTLTLSSNDPLINVLQELGRDFNTTVISLRSPYDFNLLKDVNNFICAFEDTPMAVRAAIDVLLGKQTPTGKVPITI